MAGPLERVLSRQVIACLDSNPAWSVDEVQSHLLKTHREYQRKSQTPLRSAISRALLSHRSQQSSPAPSTQAASFAEQMSNFPDGLQCTNMKQAFFSSNHAGFCLKTAHHAFGSGHATLPCLHQPLNFFCSTSAGTTISCSIIGVA